MTKQTGLPADLSNYIEAHSTPPDAALSRLTERTAELGGVSVMQIGAHQGAFLQVLVGGLAPLFAVEVGTFTGYSASCIARGLAPTGRLLCCDVSEEWTDIARTHWDEAGLADRIELVIAPAIETLATLSDRPPVDFAFIDADKGGYIDYYEALLPLLSENGVIAVDNTLWSGAVIDPDDTRGDTAAVRAFNDHVANDTRVIASLTPIGDGVTLIRKR
jgi:caffeoyl-CoA O-methyltransferase